MSSAYLKYPIILWRFKIYNIEICVVYCKIISEKIENLGEPVSRPVIIIIIIHCPCVGSNVLSAV